MSAASWCRGRIGGAPIVTLVLACLVGSTGTSRGREIESPGRAWMENYEYRVEIDGAPAADARLFSAAGRPSMLLMASALKQPIVLQVQGREVLKVNAAAVQEGPAAGTIALRDEEISGPPSPFTMDGDAVIFFMDGHRVKLSRRPPLVGAVTLQDLVAQLPAYRKGMEGYAPAESDTSYLKGYKHPVRIEVFFGSWCPHCREAVPQFLKTLSIAANDNITATFVGVPTPPFADYPPAKEKSIRGVPTFIVYAGDKEIGRMNVIPGDSSVEHELVKILFKYEQSHG